MTRTAPEILVRPDPVEGESPLGYLLRLNDVNGFGAGALLLDLVVNEGRRAPSLWAIATEPAWMAALARALRKAPGLSFRWYMPGQV